LAASHVLRWLLGGIASLQMTKPIGGAAVSRRDRIAHLSKRIRRSVATTRAIFKATRQMLKGVGLLESKSELFDIPGIIFAIAWWAVFVIVLLLPTYSAEMFFVFPTALALVVAWLLGMHPYATTLLTSDLSDVRVRPSEVSAMLRTFEDEGIEFPAEALTTEAAEQTAAALDRALPILLLQAVLRILSVAAIQALLAACVSVVGLLVAPTLSTVVWWHGWSPVSILYAFSVPPTLSLIVCSLVPFIVTRFLAALRFRRLATGQAASPAAVVGNVSAQPKSEHDAEPISDMPLD
jgi:hypothetical protein